VCSVTGWFTSSLFSGDSTKRGPAISFMEVANVALEDSVFDFCHLDITYRVIRREAIQSNLEHNLVCEGVRLSTPSHPECPQDDRCLTRHSQHAGNKDEREAPCRVLNRSLDARRIAEKIFGNRGIWARQPISKSRSLGRITPVRIARPYEAIPGRESMTASAMTTDEIEQQTGEKEGGSQKAAFLKPRPRSDHRVIHPSFPLKGGSERPIPSSTWAPFFPRTGRCGSGLNATDACTACKSSDQTIRPPGEFRARLFNDLKSPVEHFADPPKSLLSVAPAFVAKEWEAAGERRFTSVYGLPLNSLAQNCAPFASECCFWAAMIPRR
jgi:hypothetical protein